MRRTIITMVLSAMMMAGIMPTFGQNDFSSDESRIPVSIAYTPEEMIGGSAATLLSDKLKNLLTRNGLAADEGYGRFCLVASFAAETRDVLPGPPTKIAQTFDVTFYIADNYDRKIFESTTLTLKSVGTTEEKCVIDAIRHMNAGNTKLTDLVSKGKRKIIAYYEAQSSTIIATARSLAAQHQYEEAFYLLAGIPSECSSAYGKALTAGNEIFAQYTDYCCQINLAKARTLWAAEQNSSGAAKAGEYLSTIYPEAACYGEAEALYQEIKGKVLDDWHFEMKRYQDGIDLERARIDAWRQVGIAYGNHQQPVDYNVNWLVR